MRIDDHFPTPCFTTPCLSALTSFTDQYLRLIVLMLLLLLLVGAGRTVVTCFKDEDTVGLPGADTARHGG